ncbi:MAG TPA: hypothetical protein VH482_31525 [Thermomicrobiales bacterium]|jgi:hypothetical protein
MIAKTPAASTPSFLRRCTRVFFIVCAPLAAAYGLLPLPDEALYREYHHR